MDAFCSKRCPSCVGCSSESSAPAGAARDRSGCAAGGAARVPGGPAGRLRSLGVAGAAQEIRQTHYGLPDRAGAQRHEEEFVKEKTVTV